MCALLTRLTISSESSLVLKDLTLGEFLVSSSNRFRSRMVLGYRECRYFLAVLVGTYDFMLKRCSLSCSFVVFFLSLNITGYQSMYLLYSVIPQLRFHWIRNYSCSSVFFYLLYTVICVNQDKPTILSSFKPLQRGIAACMTCPSSKVIRSVHALLVKLMSTFPTESSKSVKNLGIYNYTGWPIKNRMAYFP